MSRRAAYWKAGPAQQARVYFHSGPIRRSKRGYILTMDQSPSPHESTSVRPNWRYISQRCVAQRGMGGGTHLVMRANVP
eukprot:3378790-Pyramimonas_sp.AAC.1